MKELICYEVETHFKTGDVTTDYISAESEEEMWEIYDEWYGDEVAASVIVDAWPA